MPPKNKKSPSASKSPSKNKPDKDATDSSFFTSSLHEDDWKAMVAVLVPSNAYEELFLEQIDKTVKIGQRRRFTWLSKKELVDFITENVGKKGGPSGGKKGAPGASVNVPVPAALLTLLETAKPYLDNKEEIPENLLAQILKGKLLHIRAFEKEKAIFRASLANKKTSSGGSGAKGKKDKSPAGGKKSPPKNKKAAGGPMPDIEKQTQLKKKEELDEEEKFIDDEPFDGPSHYIIISGIYSPTFFKYLDEFNLPIDCLIKFRAPSECDELLKQFLAEIDERERLETNLKANLKLNPDPAKNVSAAPTEPIDVAALSEERQAYYAKVKQDLEKFWIEINKVLEKPDDKLLQHVARIKFILRESPAFKSWFDIEARNDFSNRMFTELAEKLYSLVIRKRHYSFYVNNLKLYSVPSPAPLFQYQQRQQKTQFALPGQKEAQPAGGAEVDKVFDTRYYNELLNSVPAEYVSPSIVLYAMVEQVSANSEEKKPLLPSEKQLPDKKMPTINNLAQEVAHHFSHVIDNLALDDHDKKKLADLLPQPIENPDHVKKNADVSPHLVNHNDEIGLRLKGVFEDPSQKRHKKCQKLPFDPLDVETEMLSKSMFTIFTGIPNVPNKLAKERAARLQELFHFCTSPEITNADADRAFKQFVFETMTLTDVNKKNYIVRSDQNSQVIPWDDPYPNINETLSKEKQILLKKQNILDAKRDAEEKRSNRVSSGSTNRSIKFQDASNNGNPLGELELVSSSILKSRSSTKLSVQSVHFPDTYDIDEQKIEVVPPKTVDQVVDMINSARKRDLTDWSYAEHYDPKTLVQMLHKISYTHPYVDSYFNRRDESIMLVFSNPFDESCLSNHEEWTIKLHANVGFRNYLEKIYDMIGEWTRDEEAKYQAGIITKEVDNFKADSSTESIRKEAGSSANKSKSRSRSGSKSGSETPNKKKSASPRSDSKKKKADNKSEKSTDQFVASKTSLGTDRDETTAAVSNKSTPALGEDDYITDKFVGHQSLKAWKVEHDKQVAAANEAKERKTKGGAKSPKGGKSPDKEKKGGDAAGSKSKEPQSGRPKSNKSGSSQSPNGKATPKSKGAGSRQNSPKGKRSRSNSRTKLDAEKPAELEKSRVYDEPQAQPFIGYDVGNNMIHVKSNLTHMFPSNGALIKTERHNLKTTSNTFITASVIKDEHTFSIHLVDPADEATLLKPKSPQPENIEGSNVDIKPDESVNESVSNKYVGFTGVFKDGMAVSISAQPCQQPKTPTPTVQLEASISQNQFQTSQSMEDKDKSKKGATSTAPPAAGGPAKKGGLAAKKEASKEENKSRHGRKNQQNVQEESKEQVPEIPIVEVKEEPKYKVLPWTQLHLSVPTGLTCTFLPETYAGVAPTSDNEPHKLVVKQSYAVKCTEKAGEHLKNFNPNVLKEKSRLIKSDGTVIKFMVDNSIDVYYPNGTIYRKRVEVIQSTEPVESPVDAEKEKPKAGGKKKDTSHLADESSHISFIYKPKWLVVTPSGNEYSVNKEEQKYDLIRVYRSIKEYDDRSDETMITREDNLKMIYRPDGSSLIEFEDGTRITRFYDDPSLQQQLIANLTARSDTSNRFLHSEFKTTNMEESQFKTMYTKVECPGFATTIFNSKSKECNLAFGNGCLVTCDTNNAVYNVSYINGETLHLRQDGLISFSPKNPEGANKFNFNLNSEMVLEHEDETRNLFRVNRNGKNIIHSAVPYRNRPMIRHYQKHSPRFFIIHKDSSGTELLRFQDIKEYLSEAEIDPMTAIIKDNLQGHPNIVGTTVLRPLKNCLTDLWLSEYDEKDITPVGLRCRNLLTFPPNPEVKVAGPRFGTNIGRSLEIDLNQSRRVKNPAIIISKRMEYRQFIEYQKLSDEVRIKLINGLKEYMNHVAERADVHRKFLTHDPRTEIERLTAFKVLKIARPDHLLNTDISALYRGSINQVKHQQQKEITQHTIKKFNVNRDNKRDAKLREEIMKEKENREAWRRAFVPSYFQSEWGQNFAKHLANNNNNNNNEPTFLQTSEHDFVQNNVNPGDNIGKTGTNGTSNNYETRSDSKMSKKFSSLPPISARESDSNNQKKELPYNFNRYEPQFKQSKAIYEKKLPHSVKFNRPNAGPNEQFLVIEDPVRRKLNTSIVHTSKINLRSLEQRRGLELYPNGIKFGVLREGFTYMSSFEMVNVGIDLCRFKVQQPPTDTGLKIVFKPGPLAAGMSRDFNIVLFAVYRDDASFSSQKSDGQQQGVRNLIHELEITTETDVLKLPIEAKIVTAAEFRNMYGANLEGGKEKNIKILSVRPGNTKETVTKQPLNSLNQSFNGANFDLNKEFEKSISRSKSSESVEDEIN